MQYLLLLKIYYEFDYHMRKELKRIFPKIYLRNTYYNYIKRLWVKAKKIGLLLKNCMEFTHQIMFALQIIPFLKSEDIQSFLNEINEYIKKLPEAVLTYFLSYYNYYQNIWAKSNFIHFDQISASEWNSRGKNNCEIYHLKLSNCIEYFFLKMASLVKRIKDIIKDYTKGSMNPENENIIFSTCEAVYLFVLDYHEKYQKKINFKALFELEDEFENRMKRISIENMKSFFGLQYINGMENEDDVNLNEYNYKEIEQILPHKEPKEKAIEKQTQKNYLELIETGLDDEKGKTKKTFSNINKFNELYVFENSIKN